MNAFSNIKSPLVLSLSSISVVLWCFFSHCLTPLKLASFFISDESSSKPFFLLYHSLKLTHGLVGGTVHCCLASWLFRSHLPVHPWKQAFEWLKPWLQPFPTFEGIMQDCWGNSKCFIILLLHKGWSHHHQIHFTTSGFRIHQPKPSKAIIPLSSIFRVGDKLGKRDLE